MCFVQLVSDYSEVEMERKVAEDGMATEEYNFNSEVAIEHQVSALLHVYMFMCNLCCSVMINSLVKWYHASKTVLLHQC